MPSAAISNSIPILKTSRTIMRCATANDLDESAAMWANEEVVRRITGNPFTRAESWGRLLRYIGHWQIMGFGYWVVEDRATGEYLGEVGIAENLRDISPSLDGIPEAGWVLAPRAQGRGLATETVKAAINWFDENQKYGKIYCIIDPAHQASIRVAEKAVFREKCRIEYMGEPAIIMERDGSADNTIV